MIAITRQTSLFAATLLLFTTLATVARLYINPFPAEVSLSKFMPQLWQAAISVLMLFATAIVVNRTAVKMGIFGGFGTLPMSLFGFIGCGVLISPNLTTASAAALIVGLGTMYLIRSFAKFGQKEGVFIGSLLLSVATIVYPPCIVFGGALVLSIFAAPFNIRQTILALVGYALPIATISYIYWYCGGEITDVVFSLLQTITSNNYTIPLKPIPIFTIATTLIIIILLLCGMAMGIRYRYTQLIAVRKSYAMEIIMLLCGIGALFIPCCDITILPVIAVHAAVICAFAIDKMSQKSANYLYGALLLLVIMHLVFY